MSIAANLRDPAEMLGGLFLRQRDDGHAEPRPITSAIAWNGTPSSATAW